LPPDGGWKNYGEDPIPGNMRKITVNNNRIENTYDGEFHLETYLPHAIVGGTLLFNFQTFLTAII
jgi:hypothetical protein